MKKIVIISLALLSATMLSAKESESFSKRELGVIQGCGIGVGLKLRATSKQQISDMCSKCLNNVFHDETFTKKATEDCAEVASNIHK